MTTTAVSVIVASRGRPEALRRCLRGIDGLYHDMFEVIVVTDRAGLDAVRGWGKRIKTRLFEEPNLSRARNIGLSLSACDIVAFIDDDAIPEPTWLGRLVEPFRDDSVGAAGGFVVGRNGIRLQWGASVADQLGQRLPLETDPVLPMIHNGSAGLGIKTEGTNMAFRRELLIGIGGFDESFAFYLDETDVNLRLGAMGVATAIVPQARVHHSYAESERRRRDRVPRDLSNIGSSLAVFLAKHGTDPESRFAAETDVQRRRLIGHLMAGRIEPRDVEQLIESFRKGWRSAEHRSASTRSLPTRKIPFLPFFAEASRVLKASFLSGRSWQRQRLQARAKELAGKGETISVTVLSPTALFHRVSFTDEGYWLQTGGLFGRSEDDDPLFRFWRFSDRVAREEDRVRNAREPP